MWKIRPKVKKELYENAYFRNRWEDTTKDPSTKYPKQAIEEELLPETEDGVDSRQEA